MASAERERTLPNFRVGERSDACPLLLEGVDQIQWIENPKDFAIQTHSL